MRRTTLIVMQGIDMIVNSMGMLVIYKEDTDAVTLAIIDYEPGGFLKTASYYKESYLQMFYV